MAEDALRWAMMDRTYLEVEGCLGAALVDLLGGVMYNENLVAVHKIKDALTLNRPAYVGMCILDL